MNITVSFPPQRAPRDPHVLRSSTTHLNSLPKHTKNPKTLKELPLPYPIEAHPPNCSSYLLQIMIKRGRVDGIMLGIIRGKLEEESTTYVLLPQPC